MPVALTHSGAEYLSIKDEVDSAIERVLLGGTHKYNEDVLAFEDEFAAYCGAKYGVSVRSGHDAILISLLALGVGPGNEVITNVNGCPSMAVAISHTRATPVFADIVEKTYNIDPDEVEDAITSRTKVILPYHAYGQPYDIEAIQEIAEEHDLIVVEDASLAPGATYKGQRVGAFGEVGICSLGSGKILSAAGGGGMIVTDNRDVVERAKVLRDYGFRPIRESDGIKQEYAPGGNITVESGYNSRLDAIQAAILRVKLRKLDRWLEQRGERAQLYGRLLANIDVVTPFIMEGVTSAYRDYIILVKDRNRVLAGLQERGIQARALYLPPIHMEPLWRNLGYQEGDFPVAEQVSRELICLPMSPHMTDGEIEDIALALEELVGRATVASA